MTDLLRRLFANRYFAVSCSIAFAAISVSLAIPLFWKHQTPTIRMSAGPASTRRHAVAQYLCEQAAKNDLDARLLPSAGTEDSLERMKANQLDAAIVSNGVVLPDDDDIAVLAAMQVEAVHLLIRGKLLMGQPIVDAIRGKRVNIGEKGSTEWLLARDLLVFSHLRLPTPTESGDIALTEMGKDELVRRSRAIQKAEGRQKEQLAEELPDCLVVLASMPSTIVQSLLDAGDYKIVPLPLTRAFLMDNLQDSQSKSTVLEREFLERASIPMHSYFASRGVPESDIDTIGVRLLLVARNDLTAPAVQSLMKTLFDSEAAHRLQPKSPREIATPYATHQAANDYLDRDRPLAISVVLEWINKGLSVLGAFSAGALSIYSLLLRRKVRKPSDYYAEIRKVEKLARGIDVDAAAPIDRRDLLSHLDERLVKLRHDLLEDICEGNIKGDSVISSILALLTDARRNLQSSTDMASEAVDRPTRAYRPTDRAA